MRLDHLALKCASQDYFHKLSRPSGHILWENMSANSRPFYLACLFLDHPVKYLLVVRNYDAAIKWSAKLSLFGVPESRIRILPSGLSVLFEDASPETTALSDRLGALQMLADDSPGIIIATASSVLERTLDRETLRDQFFHLKVGENRDAMDLVDRLSAIGYEVSEPVRTPGQYSRRGGILDVYPMGWDHPVRAEFFGDEIESLRLFDPLSQRSIDPIEELTIGLSRETLLPQEPEEMTESLERILSLEASRLSEDRARHLETAILGDIDALNKGIYFDRLDLYRPLIQPEAPCAIDLLEDGILVLDDPSDIILAAERAESEFAQALEGRVERGEILHSVPLDYICSTYHFDHAPNLLGMSTNVPPDVVEFGKRHIINTEPLDYFIGQSKSMAADITKWLRDGYTIALATDQPMRAKSVLAQVDIYPSSNEENHPFQDPTGDLPTGLHLLNGNPAGGFVQHREKLAVLTDHEIFGVARLKLPQKKFSEGTPIETILDLKVGDYVVHINFGIGRYTGLVKKETAGVEREYLLIEYQAPDRLFVPADQLDRVHKYVSPGDGTPKVNKLSGNEWKKAVTKAREDAREFARELIQLYAQRKKVDRLPYGEDTPWQTEMERTFPWVETPSQMQAILDVKNDLGQPFPMDRLVCGDVGFGKTEVAIRAAFKVAESGQQVAFLCPTTILSEQHFRSFEERLAGFSTKIALLNRFVTGKARQAVIEGLAKGEIDIVIGTHALLSNELVFKNLGLLIIDEEQKFGVKHKETLKSIRVNIDILTLSATPIPRTLSMAMMNIRQMSLINDPPPGRLPVRTYVRGYADEVVHEALLRELSRGGQVFYVYNRVQGINHVAEKIRKLAPTAKVAVAHGQMTESEIEPVMVGFIKGEIDILVSTTIVESGLDIPNANTLIVENSDKFGLAQLYQLRGRVGRSDRQAYCYLLHPGGKDLTENASDRLTALSEFTQLGSGYSLAFRDLQIRGAGDLLGAKQSGQMTTVGYDLYIQLIESEVQFLKTFADGDRSTGLVDPLAGLEPLPPFDLPVMALIPESYIPDEGQRLHIYKEMMTSRNRSQLTEVAQEIEDRYGKPPGPVKTALSIMTVRLDAIPTGIKSVDGGNGRLLVRFFSPEPLSPQREWYIRSKNPAAYMRGSDLIWPYEGDPVRASHAMVASLLEGMREEKADEELANSFK